MLPPNDTAIQPSHHSWPAYRMALVLQESHQSAGSQQETQDLAVISSCTMTSLYLSNSVKLTESAALSEETDWSAVGHVLPVLAERSQSFPSKPVTCSMAANTTSSKTLLSPLTSLIAPHAGLCREHTGVWGWQCGQWLRGPGCG